MPNLPAKLIAMVRPPQPITVTGTTLSFRGNIGNIKITASSSQNVDKIDTAMKPAGRFLLFHGTSDSNVITFRDNQSGTNLKLRNITRPLGLNDVLLLQSYDDDFWHEIFFSTNDITQAELDVIEGVTPGTAAASKALVLDSSLDVATVNILGVSTLTSAALVLESSAPMTVKLNDTDALKIDNQAITGFAAESDAAGNSVFIETEDGGVDGGTASTGQNAAPYSLKTGDGSAAVTTNAAGGDGADITFTPGGGGAGAGSGVAGDQGQFKIGAGTLVFAPAQTIAMANAEVVLTLNPGTPAGTAITSNVIYADPGGTPIDLLLPPEADCDGLQLTIVSTAGGAEDIVVKEDGDSVTIMTISQNEMGICVCDGTTWRGVVAGIT